MSAEWMDEDSGPRSKALPRLKSEGRSSHPGCAGNWLCARSLHSLGSEIGSLADLDDECFAMGEESGMPITGHANSLLLPRPSALESLREGPSAL